MTPEVQSMVAATYVKDIDTSRAFYELLGFREQSAGKGETSAWSAMHHRGLSVLLASTKPPLELPQLPLLFYFFYEDLDAVVGIVERAGVPVTGTGHPPHASPRGWRLIRIPVGRGRASLTRGIQGGEMADVLLKAAGPVAAAADKLRDAVTGRGGD